MSAEMVPLDLGRMFVGDSSALFFVEIALRTVVIFGWLLLLLRWTGKRGLAQLSPLELAIVIGLGSAAGDPMFYPEVPLLHAMLVIALVVGMQRLLAYMVIHSERVEALIDGEPVELLRGGVMDRGAMESVSLSIEDLFESLRTHGVRQLGEVQRVYFEQNGLLSVFCRPHDSLPGLAVVPPWDLERPHTVPAGATYHGDLACLNCGTTRAMNGPLPPCPHCGQTEWTPAVTDPLAGGQAGRGGGRPARESAGTGVLGQDGTPG